MTPLSGPLAGFGRAGAAALQLWAEQFGGGDVDLVVFDAHPDASEAARRAARQAPDLLFGPYGSGPTELVARSVSRLLWNHGGARVTPRSNVISVLSPAYDYFAGAVEMVHHADPSIEQICLRHSDTGFGRAVADGVVATASRLGLRVERGALPADPVEADVLLVAGRFDEEVDLARRALPGRWRAVGFVGAGVDEVLESLGDRRECMLGPAQWLASAAPPPDEGPAAAAFVAAYQARVGNQPPYPAAQAFAAGLIAMRCVRDAGALDDPAVLAAAQRLDCATLAGRFRLDAAGRQVGHKVLTVQWQDGIRVVVWPPELAQAPLRHAYRDRSA